MMYLTHGEAASRLQERYGIETELTIGDVMLASEALRDLSPLKDVDLEGTLPDALLDWVALKAYHLVSDEHEGRTSVSVGNGAVSYSTPWPMKSQTARRLDTLIGPYLKRSGRVA